MSFKPFLACWLCSSGNPSHFFHCLEKRLEVKALPIFVTVLNLTALVGNEGGAVLCPVTTLKGLLGQT